MVVKRPENDLELVVVLHVKGQALFHAVGPRLRDVYAEAGLKDLPGASRLNRRGDVELGAFGHLKRG